MKESITYERFDGGRVYFLSKSSAETWVLFCGFRCEGIVYDDEFDVYSVVYYRDVLARLA